MPSASLFAASGVVPNAVFGVLSLLYVLASLYVYISLIHQIRARSLSGVGLNAPALTFGAPEAILAALLILFLSVSIGAPVSLLSSKFSTHNLIGNFLLMVFLVLFIVTFH